MKAVLHELGYSQNVAHQNYNEQSERRRKKKCMVLYRTSFCAMIAVNYKRCAIEMRKQQQQQEQ